MLKGIVVAQTHWDREWYLPLQVFRYRLLQLMDEVLELLNDGDSFKCFTTDGQTVMVEDYLEIFPERRGEIHSLVKSNRLHVGPWYVLPDEFLVSGEALIRNLMIGHRQAHSLGRVMKAGYIPDPFGHISQLPALMQGFGINSAIFGRGMGDEGDSLPSEFRWQGPGGDEVIAVHLITGYGNYGAVGYEGYDRKWGHDLQFSLDKALERTAELIDKMQEKTRAQTLLFNNGSDHLLPQKELPLVIQAVNAKRIDIVMEQGGYEDYINELQVLMDTLPLYRGELRGARFNNLLPGVLSARMYLKQKNHQAQAELERYTEPLLAWGQGLGYIYPSRLLWKAWEFLIENHPHDSICGCSIDQVHREMVPRFDQSLQISGELSSSAAQFVAGKIDTRHNEDDVIPVVAYNPHNWSYFGPIRHLLETETEGHFSVIDADGEQLPFQSNGQWVVREQGLPQVFHSDIEWLASVPPCGYRTFWLKPEESARSGHEDLNSGPVFPTWEDDLLKLDFHSDGTVNITDKSTGKVYERCLALESVGDVGDEYDFAAPVNDHIVHGLDKVQVRLEEEGPIKAVFHIQGILSLPKEASTDRRSRSTVTTDCQVTHHITIYKGRRGLEVQTKVNNTAKDHRLRVTFSIPEKVTESISEGHFDILKRAASAPNGDKWFQPPVGYHPQQTWTACGGLLVANKGLPEYEIKAGDNSAQFELTLLRSVGWLSRNDHNARPDDHAGPGFPTPEAQCLGEHTFEYGLFFFDGDWEESKIWQQAHQFVYPVKAAESKQEHGQLASSGSFPYLDNDALVITAIRPTDAGDGLVIRAYNPTSREQSARVCSDIPYHELGEVNLNEEFLQSLDPQQSLVWRAKQIRTLQLNWSLEEGVGVK